MLVFFWTDILIFILLGMAITAVFYVRAREHLRRPWRQVAQSRPAMVSLVVLSAYLCIGLLDTIHFRPASASEAESTQVFANEPISLFDWCASGLRKNEEKTYSAPFATHLYSREHLIGADGSKVWGYARLQYGGAHLTDPEKGRFADILGTGLMGAAKGFFAAVIVFIVLIAVRGKGADQNWTERVHDILKARTGIPWRAMLVTLTLVMCGFWALVELSAKYHVFGTDKVGQDVFYQSLKSIRTGLTIGILTTFIMLPFAICLGILAGFYRGWVDDVIQYLYTTLNSIPGVLLIAASILVVQVYMANHEEAFDTIAVRADTRLLFLCLILGVTSWTGLCRLLRAETLKLREMEYVQAACALGVKNSMILIRHILPNVFHIVLISVVLDFSGLVLAEAVLSYVNIGVDPTTNSWGNMINSARLEMARDPVVWWSLAAAFVFMFTMVLAANIFADAVRDAFDPRHNSTMR